MDLHRQLAEMRARVERAEADRDAALARVAALTRSLDERNAQLMNAQMDISQLQATNRHLQQQLGSSAGSTNDAEVPGMHGGLQEAGGAAAAQPGEPAGAAVAAAAQPEEPAAALPAGEEELAAEFEGEQDSVVAWCTGGPAAHRRKCKGCPPKPSAPLIDHGCTNNLP